MSVELWIEQIVFYLGLHQITSVTLLYHYVQILRCKHDSFT